MNPDKNNFGVPQYSFYWIITGKIPEINRSNFSGILTHVLVWVSFDDYPWSIVFITTFFKIS